MGFYQRHLFPRILDVVMRQEPIMRRRSAVVPRARGHVLEIGMGSGLNLGLYDRAKVERLYGLEPSPDLQRLARQRAEAAGIGVEFLTLGSEEIPLADASVDTVMTTWTLCSIAEVERALAEMRRVLKPGGQLLFAEHGRAPDPGVLRWQDRLNPIWRRLSSGCNMNRPIVDLISERFAIRDLESAYLPGPRVLAFNYWGSATPA
jgi:ubiquinone/menaquinone biosynthesis C-methylase UbiE